MKKLLLIFTCIILLTACKKQELQPQEDEFKQITYTMYCTTPKYVFKYVSGENQWHTDTIRTSSYSLTVGVREVDFGFVTQVFTVNKYNTDSISITAICDGKHVSAHSYKKMTAASVQIQLSQLK